MYYFCTTNFSYITAEKATHYNEVTENTDSSISNFILFIETELFPYSFRFFTHIFLKLFGLHMRKVVMNFKRFYSVYSFSFVRKDDFKTVFRRVAARQIYNTNELTALFILEYQCSKSIKNSCSLPSNKSFRIY